MQLIPAGNVFDSVIDFLPHCFAMVDGLLFCDTAILLDLYLTCFNSAFSFFVFTDINVDCQMFSSLSSFTVVSPSHKQTSNIYCHVITDTIVGMYWENRSLTVFPH